MSPSLALSVWAAGVLGLFYLDRERGARPSKALWLPIIWLLVNGSRPVSLWLGAAPLADTQQQVMEGNPIDAAVLGLLLALALFVLWTRRQQVRPVLSSLWPVALYFAYCLFSVLWSDIAGIALRRWVKSLGDLAMVLVLVTETDLSAALGRLFSRPAAILLPASIVAIKYFPAVGRYYDQWSGVPYNQGVAVTKNGLGGIAFVLTLGAVWQVVGLVAGGRRSGRLRRLLAQSILLGFGVWVLALAHSATADASLALGASFVVLTSFRSLRRKAAVRSLTAAILLVGGLMLWLGAEGEVTHALGRKSDLTGRTAIWRAVLAQAARSPLLGVGFESFWTGPNDEAILRRLPPGEGANESHNGYVEVYAEIGLIGLGLLAAILVAAYRRAVAAFDLSPRLGGVLVGFVAGVAIYNVAEAGFRLLSPTWFALLAVFAAAARLAVLEGGAGRSAPLPAGWPQ